MNPALQKTLELLLIIGIGVLLQRKLSGKAQLEGVKVIILNVALPATIFLALLKVELDAALLFLPALALGFNLFLFAAVHYTIGFFAPAYDGPARRTLAMLLPSLAPGLSCFPFIMAYQDDSSLALAALADVGNKFFGLIMLYLLAMHWYRARALKKDSRQGAGNLRGLLASLLREPVNLVIGVALILLIAGLDLESLPGVITATVNRFSVMMVALVLLFIGMAVRVSRTDLRDIAILLSWRSGLALLFSSVCVLLSPGLAPAMVLLLVVFPQSSCSFWPFAHMHLVAKLEENQPVARPTFNLDFGVNVLACSLPFSSLMILLIFNFGEYFTDPALLAGAGAALVLVPLLARFGFRAARRVRNGIPENVLP